MSPKVAALGQGGMAASENMMQCTTLVGTTDSTLVSVFVSPHFPHMWCQATIYGRIEHEFDDLRAGAMDQVVPR